MPPIKTLAKKSDFFSLHLLKNPNALFENSHTTLEHDFYKLKTSLQLVQSQKLFSKIDFSKPFSIKVCS